MFVGGNIAITAENEAGSGSSLTGSFVTEEWFLISACNDRDDTFWDGIGDASNRAFRKVGRVAIPTDLPWIAKNITSKIPS